jgi:hypothetical protein
MLYTIPSTVQSTPVTVPVNAQTYATQWNARYSKNNNKTAVYVTLKQRLDAHIASLPIMSQKAARTAIVSAAKTWSNNWPMVKTFEDLPLVETQLRPMSAVLIDVTIQRLLNLNWIGTIISNFSPFKVTPICVYVVQPGGDLATEYPVGTELYGCWDSQHTAIALYIIATQCLGLNPDDVQVPIALYKVTNRKDIRETFVSLNTADGKKLLDAIDIFMQMVLGVRVDDNNNPKWQDAAMKQTYLEEAGLFVTDKKYNNTHLAGAISRMQEIDSYNSNIIRQFCMYATTITTPRPIASQEIEIMCKFFALANLDGMEYSDDQIIDLGNHLHQLFDADFDESSEFWEKVKTAYKNWHASAYKSVPKNLRPKYSKVSKNQTTGIPFLIHQLNKTWKHPVPACPGTTSFVPATQDLY